MMKKNEEYIKYENDIVDKKTDRVKMKSNKCISREKKITKETTTKIYWNDELEKK